MLAQAFPAVMHALFAGIGVSEGKVADHRDPRLRGTEAAARVPREVEDVAIVVCDVEPPPRFEDLE